MKKITLALCAALMAAPLGFAAPAMAQGFSFSVGPDGPRVGFYSRGPNAWYNGHRGYRDRRSGWRYYRGYWFPPDAFVVTRSIDRDRYHRRANSNAHVEWCYDRYKSYRASDNTYQPYNGGRRQCYSPYS
jgi:hypothetical protein